MNKIFQIGFNKCGTVSLYVLFQFYTEPKIKSVHWEDGKLASSMFYNLQNNKKLLDNYNDVIFFSDMETCILGKYHYMFKFFDILDTQYPKSKFILNTRPIKNWIQSRLNHKIIYDNPNELLNNESYLSSQINFYKTNSIDEIISIWIDEWNYHHNKVINYFKDRPDDLLIFDIEKDSLDKIKNFLPNIKFTVNSLPFKNKSKESA